MESPPVAPRLAFALFLALVAAAAAQSGPEEDPGRRLFDGERVLRRGAPVVPGALHDGGSGLAPFTQSAASSGAALTRAATPRPVLDELRDTVARLSSPELGGRAPMTAGSELARRHIVERFERYGVEPAGRDGGFVEPLKQRFTRRTIGHNVVGRVLGSRAPEECVYVEAHYDHWGRSGGKLQPGANDNASGVAVMLELARAIAISKPERTVVFLAADYEEGALLPMLGGIKGSRAHARHPACPAEKIKASLVIDMMGGRFIAGLDRHLFLIGSESSSATYALAGRAASSSAATVRRLGVYAIEPMGSMIPRGDYAAFRDLKAPFIFATSGIPAFYHTPEDTIDKIDFEFMASALEISLGLVREMASADFAAAYAGSSEAIDWESERLLGLEMARKIADGQPEPQRRDLEKLQIRLREARAPNDIEDAVQDLTMTVMKLNKAVKLGEHLLRTHGER